MQRDIVVVLVNRHWKYNIIGILWNNGLLSIGPCGIVNMHDSE